MVNTGRNTAQEIVSNKYCEGCSEKNWAVCFSGTCQSVPIRTFRRSCLVEKRIEPVKETLSQYNSKGNSQSNWKNCGGSTAKSIPLGSEEKKTKAITAESLLQRTGFPRRDKGASNGNLFHLAVKHPYIGICQTGWDERKTNGSNRKSIVLFNF